MVGAPSFHSTDAFSYPSIPIPRTRWRSVQPKLCLPCQARSTKWVPSALPSVSSSCVSWVFSKCLEGKFEVEQVWGYSRLPLIVFAVSNGLNLCHACVIMVVAGPRLSQHPPLLPCYLSRARDKLSPVGLVQSVFLIFQMILPSFIKNSSSPSFCLWIGGLERAVGAGGDFPTFPVRNKQALGQSSMGTGSMGCFIRLSPLKSGRIRNLNGVCVSVFWAPHTMMLGTFSWLSAQCTAWSTKPVSDQPDFAVCKNL